MLDKFYDDEKAKLILRLTVGILMLFHGIAKILNPGSLGFIGSSLLNLGFPAFPAFFAYAVYIGEVIAPLMIISGFKARVGGMLIVITMIVAVVLVHPNDIFSLSKHGGLLLELQIFFLIGGLLVAMFGSEKFALKPD